MEAIDKKFHRENPGRDPEHVSAACLPESLQPISEAMALGLVIPLLLWRPNGPTLAFNIGRERV